MRAAPSCLDGSNRLVFTGHSPCWEVDRPELDEWLRRFEQDRSAGRDYWYEVRKGVDEALEEPLGE